MATIYVDDIGTKFRVTIMEDGVALDISTASVKTFKFQSPSGITKDATAGFYTDGTDGILEYATVADFLDEVGKWILQTYLEVPAWKGHSTQYKFKVSAHI